MRNNYSYSIFLFSLLLSVIGASAQGLINDGAKINLVNGAYLNIDGPNGNFTNTATAGAQVTNNQSFIEVEGNWINNNSTGVFGISPDATTGGTVRLDGDAQNIGGTQETRFFNLVVKGTDVKTLTGTGSATGTTTYGTLTLTNQQLALNQRILTVENQDNSTAFSRSGIGSLISETAPPADYGVVKWNIGDATTTPSYPTAHGQVIPGNSTPYVVPFGRATGDVIPLTYSVYNQGLPVGLSAGDDDYRTFATYGTSVDNLPIPYDVSAIGTEFNSVGVGGQTAVDRFWIIDEDINGPSGSGFSSSNRPIIIYTLEYVADERTGNSGISSASDLRPQRYNHDEDRWYDWLYTDGTFSSTGNGWTFTIGLDDPHYDPSGVSVPGSGGTSNPNPNWWLEDQYPVWTLVDQSDPLPIELVRFVGQCDGENVELRWTTWTETNNDFFTLERSLNGEDFETVDILNGAGNSNQPISYELVDQNAFSGTSYYRLKMTDTYGKISYSSVIVVTCGDGSIDFNFVNAYDVDHTEIVVEFTAHENEDFNILLFDAAGRRALDYSGVAINGMNKVRLPSGSLAQGIYVINLNNNIKNYSKKVLLH